MYTDNHIHDIVVKRNPSSSRKRSRDGIRSHITPAKKRSSFTSTECTSGEGHNCAQNMTENKGTELVSSLLFIVIERYTIHYSIMMFFLYFSSAAVTMRTYLRVMTALYVTAPFWLSLKMWNSK